MATAEEQRHQREEISEIGRSHADELSEISWRQVDIDCYVGTLDNMRTLLAEIAKERRPEPPTVRSMAKGLCKAAEERTKV